MILQRSFYLNTTPAIDIINISHEIRSLLKESKADRGGATVIAPNGGAGIVAMEPGVQTDEIRKGLEPLLANGLVRCLLSKSLVVPFEQGRLMTDPRQEVFLIDYEPSGRRREFRVQLYWESKEAHEPAKK